MGYGDSKRKIQLLPSAGLDPRREAGFDPATGKHGSTDSDFLKGIFDRQKWQRWLFVGNPAPGAGTVEKGETSHCHLPNRR